jgi:hypothetical protein
VDGGIAAAKLGLGGFAAAAVTGPVAVAALCVDATLAESTALPDDVATTGFGVLAIAGTICAAAFARIGRPPTAGANPEAVAVAIALRS